MTGSAPELRCSTHRLPVTFAVTNARSYVVALDWLNALNQAIALNMDASDSVSDSEQYYAYVYRVALSICALYMTFSPKIDVQP